MLQLCDWPDGTPEDVWFPDAIRFLRVVEACPHKLELSEWLVLVNLVNVIYAGQPGAVAIFKTHQELMFYYVTFLSWLDNLKIPYQVSYGRQVVNVDGSTVVFTTDRPEKLCGLHYPIFTTIEDLEWNK